MEPEWNNQPNLDDAVILGLRKLDVDDYINGLQKKIDQLNFLIDSLKLEIKTQRKEIDKLKEERRTIINNDNLPGRCIQW